jgi:hypothetical protein
VSGSGTGAAAMLYFNAFEPVWPKTRTARRLR